MPRRRVARPSTPPLRAAPEQRERKADGEWYVRATRGSSMKDYRCPGCSQLIGRGLGHVVVWPVEKALLSEAAIDERRHWHTACWARRH
ncbi:hypothetical protein GEV29_09405 [Aeromicrobium sp. SMF47]|uniref:hypothetical protein n=1 Tax=Aeromicrobium yanjiei TaxID=2662028 RepID=UPI00129DC233|nr:hypothetical protein [Aeromicrobium yanjiei]MRJ76752.1 hypothetical protein [Aeromicrobium yanjiei]